MKKIGLLILLINSVFSAEGLFHKMKPASKVFWVDARGDDINSRLTIQSMQGLLNQDSAEVYVLTANHHREQLDLGGLPTEELVRPAGNRGGLRALFGKFQNRIQKINVYDTLQNWSFYLALMDGAQNQGIPATEEIKDMLQSEFGWNGQVEDFRNRWNNSSQAYDWAIQNQMPKVNKKVVLVGNFTMLMFDYAVASKSFLFWLSFNNRNDSIQIDKIMEAGKYGVGVSLMGYADNGDHANILVNKFGVGYVTSDYYANASFWSSFPNKTYTQTRGKGVIAEKGKVYVSLLWSDGDNLQFDQNGLYLSWKDPFRGTVPMGTALAPIMQEMNTPLMDHYFDNKTKNDELIAGPCGFQFIYTVHFDNNQLPEWMALNREWVKDAGFHSGSLWWTTYPSTAYDLYTSTTTLDGLFHNFNNIGNKPIFSNGVGVFREYITECRDTECVYRDIAGVASNPNQPEFRAQKLIQPAFMPNGFEQVKGVVDRLNNEFPDKYVFLLPSDFIATAKQYYGNNEDIYEAVFLANNEEQENRFIQENNGSNTNGTRRIANGNSNWVYHFDIEDEAKLGLLQVDLAGDYVIRVSKDNSNWHDIGTSTGVAQRSVKEFDITTALENNSSNKIYVQFADKSPQNGNGVQVWKVTLETSNIVGLRQLNDNMNPHSKGFLKTKNGAVLYRDGASDSELYWYDFLGKRYHEK